MKVKCKCCDTIVEGDKKGHLISCACGKIAIDETPYYCRLNYESKDCFEIIDEGDNKQGCGIVDIKLPL